MYFFDNKTAVKLISQQFDIHIQHIFLHALKYSRKLHTPLIKTKNVKVQKPQKRNAVKCEI